MCEQQISSLFSPSALTRSSSVPLLDSRHSSDAGAPANFAKTGNSIKTLTTRVQALEEDSREINETKRTIANSIKTVAQIASCFFIFVTVTKLMNNIPLIERECRASENGCDFASHAIQALQTYQQLNELHAINATNFGPEENALLSTSINLSSRVLNYELANAWHAILNFAKAIASVPEVSKWAVRTICSLLFAALTTIVLK